MESEHEIGDQHEERRLRQHDDAVQRRLVGMWGRTLEGCPHRHGVKDSIDCCDADEMRPCFYEVYHDQFEGMMGCEIFQEILAEWKEELEVKV